jgi:hypothetical protein
MTEQQGMLVQARFGLRICCVNAMCAHAQQHPAGHSIAERATRCESDDERMLPTLDRLAGETALQVAPHITLVEQTLAEWLLQPRAPIRRVHGALLPAFQTWG